MNGWDHVTHLSELEKRCTALWFKTSPTLFVGPLTGLIVGECPGKNTRSTLPLYPYPPNSSGGRLMAMSGLQPHDYLGRLLRQNLFYDHQDIWNKDEAVEAACKIVETVTVSRIVLCGQRVAEAFGFRKFFQLHQYRDRHYVAIPHPSGLNRVYNDVNARLAGGATIRWAAGLEIFGGGK